MSICKNTLQDEAICKCSSCYTPPGGKSELAAPAGLAHWMDITTLDRSQMDFVLVTEDGAVRLHLWNPHRNCWERAYPIGSLVQDGEDCSNPTHWMPCPNAPNAEVSGAKRSEQ